MQNPAKGTARLVRGLTVGTVCALLSITGHEIGGGGVCGAGILFVVGIFGLLGVIVADHELETWRLAMLVLGSTLLGHVVLTCAHQGHGSASSHAGHTSLLAMVAGHAFAALALALLLRAGDATIFAWYRFLGQRIGEALVTPIVLATSAAENRLSTSPNATELFDVPPFPRSPTRASVISRRGPPLFSFAQ